MSLPEKVTTDESSPAAPWLAPPDDYDPVIEAYKKDVDRTLAGQFSAADCLTAPPHPV